MKALIGSDKVPAPGGPCSAGLTVGETDLVADLLVETTVVAPAS